MPEARRSSSPNGVIDSTPAARLPQNSSRSRAPGTRHAIPMTAMPELSGVIESRPPRSALPGAAAFTAPLSRLPGRIGALPQHERDAPDGRVLEDAGRGNREAHLLSEPRD